MIEQLRKFLGERCTAINVDGEFDNFIHSPQKKMKFCEAVNHSFSIPLRLTNENLICPGARRCMNFDHDDKKLAKVISDNNKIPEDFIQLALTDIPALKTVRCINLGLTESMEQSVQPDLFIAYVKPSAITAIIHELARHDIKPIIPPYSLLSVCGNIFANCYLKKRVSISFGCPESRLHGGIHNEEVILGIPCDTANLLITSHVHL
jgi:uncharacterized protein (DUF169 family)